MFELPKKITLTTLSLSDPLSKETESKRAHLLFTACASILLTVYGLRINKTPWLDIEVPAGAPNILHGALSVALIYTLVVFLIHSWTDFTRWWVAREVIVLKGYRDHVLHLHTILAGVEGILVKLSSDTDTPQQRVETERSLQEANVRLDSLLKEIHELQRRHTALTTVQFLRLALIDIGVPVSLAVVALAKIGSAIPPFVSAILR